MSSREMKNDTPEQPRVEPGRYPLPALPGASPGQGWGVDRRGGEPWVFRNPSGPRSKKERRQECLRRPTQPRVGVRTRPFLRTARAVRRSSQFPLPGGSPLASGLTCLALRCWVPGARAAGGESPCTPAVVGRAAPWPGRGR